MRFPRLFPAIILLMIFTSGVCAAPAATAVAPPSADPLKETPSPQTTPPSTPPPAASPTLSPTPLPTPSPTPEPDLSDMYYTEGGEYYYIDPKGTYWLYSCEDLYVYVQRLTSVELHINYFVASIRVKNPDRISVGLSDEKNPGAHRVIQEKLAAKHQAVLSINGDFFTDRNTGIIIRDGKIFRNRPNEDILALYADGNMGVFDGKEKTPEELIAEGVTDTFAFGPILLRNGEIYSDAIDKHPLRGLNPRTGIGMIEKGHYLAIVVEGRQSYSRGIRLGDFAKLFAGYGCQMAYNLDGGQSAVVTFMGIPLNNHDKDSGVDHEYASFRSIPEILIFGTSPDVPTKQSKTDAVAIPPRIVGWLNESGLTDIPVNGQTAE